MKLQMSTGLVWLLVLLAAALPAWAQGQVAPNTALVLDVARAPQLPTAQVLAAALEAELAIHVSLFQVVGQQTARLSVAAAGPNRARVAFLLPGRPLVGREVQLPRDPMRAVDTLTLLLANMVHSEAGELLASLRAVKRSELAAPPVVLEPPPAVPAPAPPTPVALLPPPADPTPIAQPSAATPVDFAADGLRTVLLGVDLVPGITFPPAPFEGTVRRFSFGGITYSSGLDGMEAAAIGTLHSGDVKGGQFSSVFNAVRGDVRGFQGASSLNVVGGKLHGAQLSSGANLAGEVDGGLQMAVFNGVLRSMRGAQLGVANAVAGPVAGLQLGLVNLAGEHVHGAQIGLVNLGKSADAGIGLLSLYSDGRSHVQAWTDGALGATVGVEHGSKRMHNLFAVGAQPVSNAGHWQPHAGLGLGIHLQPKDWLTVDFDALEMVRYDRDRSDWFAETQLRVVGGVRLFSSVRLIGGPTWAVRVAGVGAHLTTVVDGRNTMVRFNISDRGARVAMDLGWFVGLSVF